MHRLRLPACLQLCLRRAGKSQKITITNDKGRLSKDEIERMVQVGPVRVVIWLQSA